MEASNGKHWMSRQMGKFESFSLRRYELPAGNDPGTDAPSLWRRLWEFVGEPEVSRNRLLARNNFRTLDWLATDKIHERCGAPGEAPPFAASQKTRMSDDVTGSIRASYDQLADEYARRIFNELQYKPLDRELLDRFATEVSGHGEVCDLGCGPGHVARYLRDRGTRVFGLDLSPKMIDQARQLSPDMPFREGNMMALDLQEGTLAGITAFYAIVNIPKESLPSVFREIRRVLQPGGLLLLAFHTGDEVLHEQELWGRSISMDFFLFQPSEIRQYLEAEGLVVEEMIELEPYAPEVEYQSRRAYIFARKPGSV